VCTGHAAVVGFVLPSSSRFASSYAWDSNHTHTTQAFLDDVVVAAAPAPTATPRADADVDPDLSFKLINSFFPKECQRTKDFPCVLANCLYADR